jgi:alcohol dehydrogenase class IV
MDTLSEIAPPQEILIVPSGLLTSVTLHEAWRLGPPTVVAIGGGSVLDAAKLIRLANIRKSFPATRDLRTPNDETAGGSLICLPTTAGSGSELTATSSLWDDGIKSSIDGPALQPSDAIYDADLMISAGAEIRVAALWDAITHALEALWSRRASPVSDQYASFALRTISDVLKREGQPTDAALPALAFASSAAGAAITLTRTGIAHALSYPLTARHGLRHGLAAGLFGIAAASLIDDIAPERAARIDRALAGPRTSLRALWQETGASQFVATAVSSSEIRAQASSGLNPDRAELSVIPPEPDVVRELCDRAAGLRAA